MSSGASEMRLEMVTEIEVRMETEPTGPLEPLNSINQLTGPLEAP